MIFDAILCLNTNLPDVHFFKDYAGVPVFAADGAAQTLWKLGLVPEAILGDGDSILSLPEIWRERWVPLTDQNYTDFEKALQYLRAKGYQHLLVLGMHGGDVDHTLHNLALLVQYGKTMHLVGVDALATPHNWLYPLWHSCTFSVQQLQRISLLPFPSARITTRGLHWNLEDKMLDLLQDVSMRNQVAERNVHITLHEGSLLLVLQEQVEIFPLLEGEGI